RDTPATRRWQVALRVDQTSRFSTTAPCPCRASGRPTVLIQEGVMAIRRVFFFLLLSLPASWLAAAEQIIAPPPPEPFTRFGDALAVDDDVLAVGAPNADNGEQTDSGAV